MDNWSTDKEFLETFRAEAEERIQILSKGLMALEDSPSDEELLKRLFREAHTLKGAAGMMGLDAIKELSHRVEDILSSIQKKQIEYKGPVADLLLESLDRIEEMLPTGNEESGNGGDVKDLLERLGRVEAVGANAGQQSEGNKAEPSLPLESFAVNETKAGPYSATNKTVARSDTTIRVNIERLDKLLNLMGEILVNQVDSEAGVRELSGVYMQTQELKRMMEAVAEQLKRIKANVGSHNVDACFQKLNKAEDMLLSITGNLGQAAIHLKDNTASRRLALDELHDKALHVRMLPLSTIFSLYPRVVRDASSASGKVVKLNISGEKTELDKRILEQVADPIMHIIRNAVDHGIELPTERTSIGKAQQGMIRLDAIQKGDRVEIQVSDDGAGINLEKLKSAAVRKGMISEKENLTGEEIIDLIFKPGFSTAESVTTISGRGVGLDVVKNNLEMIEGTVAVESTPGTGTKFIVSLPVTLAVISGLLVESGREKFIIPVASIQEIVDITESEIQTLAHNSGFILRGEAIPLIDLMEVLSSYSSVIHGGKTHVIIAGADRHRIGIRVDSLLGEQEIVVKSIGDFLPKLPNIAGVSILGNGEAVLVLNVNEIVREAKQHGSHKREVYESGYEETVDGKRKLVLVVEDSLVVRELQRNILEAAGYEVETAVDGNDALCHLAQHTVDCVVTDIEMPGMDGFKLTSLIREKEDIREVPVIMVTAQGSDEFRKKGVQAGADAYVVKGTFDQQSLLDTIERLVA